MEADIIVDATFKSCPGPLIALSQAVSAAAPQKIVKLLATDPAAPSDVKEWTSSVGHKLLSVERSGDVFEIYIEVME
ncbi:sulfurtransferase TusA family protein [Methanogenium sp. S4BF]|uniref:sulfurtransferase TusA family protein n=1 Tax=Methanogenium sp. S4BF TaxID=1789226 RepID=UPI002416855A|nr:sulfurtransferase TusA family protein [Methanogenium sp. S4BF]WFN35346.1 sulfurtransferase TusA family protein [Methanogenium sp. S4BF]